VVLNDRGLHFARRIENRIGDCDGRPRANFCAFPGRERSNGLAGFSNLRHRAKNRVLKTGKMRGGRARSSWSELDNRWAGGFTSGPRCRGRDRFVIWRCYIRQNSARGGKQRLQLVAAANDQAIMNLGLSAAKSVGREHKRACDFSVVAGEVDPRTHLGRFKHPIFLIEVNEIEREDSWYCRNSVQGSKPESGGRIHTHAAHHDVEQLQGLIAAVGDGQLGVKENPTCQVVCREASGVHMCTISGD